MDRRLRGRDDLPARGSVHALPDGDTLEVELSAGWNDPGFSRVVWRVRDGAPVVMVKLFTESNSSAPGVAVICDVEVRDGFRGQRLGLDTLTAIGDRLCVPLRVSGSYTPSGFAAFGAHLQPTCASVEPRACFDEMVFVEDWDSRLLRYP